MDCELDDSVLIRCTEQVEKSYLDTSEPDSEEEGDIDSLLTHVRRNLGQSVGVDIVAGKPPACPPKKGYNIKSSKIQSVAGPSHIGEGEETDENSQNGQQSRFHKASVKEIETLQLDAKDAQTHAQTKWGVKIMRSQVSVSNTTVSCSGRESCFVLAFFKFC